MPREYKEKTIGLNGNRKLINACKKNDLYVYNPRGKWTKYGYEKLPMVVKITSLSEMRKFNKIKKEVEESELNKPPAKTSEEKRLEWEKRLCRLTGIDPDSAHDIAQEKIDFQQKQISDLADRQCEHYSYRREDLITKISKENPLKYIKSKEHGFAILAASERHNSTYYDQKLEIIHRLEQSGQIERGNAKEMARTLSVEELLEYDK